MLQTTKNIKRALTSIGIPSKMISVKVKPNKWGEYVDWNITLKAYSHEARQFVVDKIKAKPGRILEQMNVHIVWLDDSPHTYLEFAYNGKITERNV